VQWGILGSLLAYVLYRGLNIADQLALASLEYQKETLRVHRMIASDVDRFVDAWVASDTGTVRHNDDEDEP
jgi:hypothetical protein